MRLCMQDYMPVEVRNNIPEDWGDLLFIYPLLLDVVEVCYNQCAHSCDGFGILYFRTCSYELVTPFLTHMTHAYAPCTQLMSK